ncbi:MAG TPA: trypsin-like peptidase domain-containing protein [Dongiaceae bacterium]|nr:trypsin-like peptidase domain-containing protein [Dongiaceae bacterium]
MTLQCAFKFWRAIPALGLLAALAVSPPCPAQAPPALPPSPDPAKTFPKDAGLSAVAAPAALRSLPARRQELAAAFSKLVPTSLADLRAMERQVKSLVRQVSPAVVAVEVGYGSGSGVVITADGLVLSAGHVCGRPHRDVLFTFPDGKTARGKTVGVDVEADTGLMRITDPGPWPHVAVGDLEEARLGDWVLALGHPGGFDPRRSLVVRLGRIIRAAPGVVQTDCTISPGDSGGPLFDMHGRVLGVHSAISRSLAENFHVPITEFFDTWTTLASGGNGDTLASRPRADAGASAADDPAGCRVTAVEKGGPAFNAGLQPGDLVLKVEGRDIPVSAVFRRWIAEAMPGETLNLEIKRGDQLLSLQVKLQIPPDGK